MCLSHCVSVMLYAGSLVTLLVVGLRVTTGHPKASTGPPKATTGPPKAIADHSKATFRLLAILPKARASDDQAAHVSVWQDSRQP